MPKLFYTLEEAMEALGVTSEDIKQLCREGKLRSFGFDIVPPAEYMFKVDQVEALTLFPRSRKLVYLDIGDYDF